ncbi:DUF2269 domain-containing protein [Streptomyces sp. MST-110588]|uniref:DUF2269 domain-containing protein n=1 Tax=Streptomyces sp. MST-110588 TaxID=2833628 RepID=UPI001F5CDAE7|nr:DUF2269 domain-containing protein [Streptomyces sp. MST-110588]UNO40917.1 DUF2269 domain-containing protein [Streptomyces sp. MST-110588]
MRQLPRPARRALLVVHVAVSVGWFGLTLGLLTLSVTGWATGSPDIAVVTHRAMKIFSDWLLIPVALLTLISGLVLALGTRWGLARHRWIVVKFWLTVVTVLLTAFSLRPGIAQLAARAAAGSPATDVGMVVAPAVATATYFFITAVSVLKPWGLTKRGVRLRGAQAGRMRPSRSADRQDGPVPQPR